MQLALCYRTYRKGPHKALTRLHINHPLVTLCTLAAVGARCKQEGMEEGAAHLTPATEWSVELRAGQQA